MAVSGDQKAPIKKWAEAAAEAAVASAIPSFLCYSNNSVQSINGTDVAIDWQVPNVTTQGADITWDTGNKSRITFPTAGTYEISASVYMTSLVVRASVGIQFRLNGSGKYGPVGASGYIRSLSSHNESSVHLTPFLVTVAAGDYVELVCNQLATAGTVNTVARTSYITARRLK